jgi:hypothetical protein
VACDKTKGLDLDLLFLHHNFVFELSREWWSEAGMQGFIAGSRSYTVDSQSFPNRSIYIVRVDEVAPVPRELSHGVFNNDAQTGLSAKDRVIKILRGFVANATIPPIELVRLPASAPYTYKLTHGAHRFYLSIAAGFTHVPAVNGHDREL